MEGSGVARGHILPSAVKRGSSKFYCRKNIGQFLEKNMKT